MALPENTSYGQENTDSTQVALRAAQNFARNLPKPKKAPVDVSQYSGVLSAINRQPQAPTINAAPPQGRADWVTEQGADLRKYGAVTTRYGGSTVSPHNMGRGEASHPGIDVAAGMGARIPALRSGTVTEVRTGHKHGEPNSFGNSVVVTDAAGNKWRYSHLSRAYVKVGQKVAAGDYIAAEGNTGNAFSRHGGTGSHLDLRIMNLAGKHLDPRTLGVTY